jgi:uncharacterized membrane protein HdeD (DUF308 family)
MATEVDHATTTRRRNITGLIVVIFGILTLLAPLGHEEVVGGRAGLLLVLTAILEFVHGFRRAKREQQRSAWVSSAITLAMGILLLNTPFLASKALVLFLCWLVWSGCSPVSLSVCAWQPP